MQIAHPFRRTLVGIGILVALVAGFMTTNAAYAQSAPRTWKAAVGVESSNHAIQGMVFLPHDIFINVGDTVNWTAKGGDIHTVTFLAPGQPLPPGPDPVRTTNTHYDGHSYYNSGFLTDFAPVFPGAYLMYSLTFDVTGTFTYFCTVHPDMQARIHVRRAGTPYPYTQNDYNRDIHHSGDRIMDRGAELMEMVRGMADSHHVIVGYGKGNVSLMRFFPSVAHIKLGDSITFTNMDMMEPHTVTFGTLPAGFNDFNPLGDPTNFTGAAPLSSGFIGVVPGWHGDTYTVTFKAKGTFAFYCDLHDYMGMVMSIVVS